MSREILIAPLTAEAFAPFGEVLEATGDPDRIINQGLCGRFHDRATLDIVEGRAGISLFKSEARSLPYVLDMVERHPLGSQAFLPMSLDPFLVIVAPDEGGAPGTPLAFRTAPGQGINLHRGTVARRSHAARAARPFRGDRPDRPRREPAGTLVRSPWTVRDD
jgi:ureidoglycolate lyase